MATKSALLRSHSVLPKLLPSFHLRLISTSSPLSQEPQLEPSPPPSAPTPLPPKPSTGSPFYNESWRNPKPTAASAASLLPVPGQSAAAAQMAFSQTLDLDGITKLFGDYVPSQRWNDITSAFEYWVRSLDGFGKLNKPDVDLFNHYLRAKLMLGADSAELLDLVQEMHEFEVLPNAASYNLVFEAMVKELESINSQQGESAASQSRNNQQGESAASQSRKTALADAATKLFDK